MKRRPAGLNTSFIENMITCAPGGGNNARTTDYTFYHDRAQASQVT